MVNSRCEFNYIELFHQEDKMLGNRGAFKQITIEVRRGIGASLPLAKDRD